MINAMSDLETDTATQEINAAKASPWPPDMRDQIWSDRLLLRFKMKKDMKVYRSFLEDIVKDNNDASSNSNIKEVDRRDAIPILHNFCTNELSPKELRQLFQLPRSELIEILNSKYKICGAYGVVFCTVSEQVVNSKVTGYGIDARHSPGDDNSEEIFEKELKYKKVGPGFCLDITTQQDDGTDIVNEDVLNIFLQRMVSLAGPTLLNRAPKTSHQNEGSGSDSDKDGSDGAEEEDEPNIPSFRSDRRVIRLFIARYWADRLIEKYNQRRKADDQVGDEEVVQ